MTAKERSEKTGKTVYLPDALWLKVQELADREHRSVSAQIAYILEKEVMGGDNAAS